MRYQHLVETVRGRAALDSTARARAATSVVLTTLAHCLAPADRHRVAERLPGLLAPAVEVPGQRERRHGEDLLVEIGQRLHTTPERARYLGQAVLGVLREEQPDLVDQLRDQLSTDLLDVLAPAGQPAWLAESTRPDVPTRLSDADVAAALRRLTGWTGDRSAISRTVSLPDDRLTPLVNRVQRVAAREFNDHAHVERGRGWVRFTLSTQRGAVTAPDVALAARIDQVVSGFGSGGRPGPAR
ncbi:DUF2267 domain-containing protein [Goodfellowiella coeruleoviolacea]|uniref:Putative pterin-4-alpha-carbinolamine dehydratase n=1 Tax=Goodfellowiella coeruleoviolacea TaxID=334858 RepID=A0AAE3GER2_9PSEU|nr:DUF2267 domain-containing protein [Goodfellowiella coeruleoviolacea]MCP2164788.1 Pterin-4a-carbinolamine dehydratase [Goodfellowiella coeruleoviolacea]